MKILIDIGHPAHVHYFRNLRTGMMNNGHELMFIARDKEVSHQLLDEYKIPYVSRKKGKRSLIGKLIYTIKADYTILKLSRKFNPKLLLSFGSPYLAHVSKIINKPHVALTDTEHAKLGLLAFKPFSSVILTPFCFNKNLGQKHLRFNSFMELCYLHPNYFEPNISIYKLLKIEPVQKYVLLRFISWNASHDIGQSGLDLETKRKIVEKLKNKFKVFISSESELPFEFEQYKLNIPVHRIHDVLAYSSLFIGEGATMASECAILGTPAIYVNSLDAGTLQEQERLGLIVGFRNSKGVIEKMDEWLANENIHKEMKVKRDKMMEGMIDPTMMFLWFLENYPESVKILKENPEYQYNFR